MTASTSRPVPAPSLGRWPPVVAAWASFWLWGAAIPAQPPDQPAEVKRLLTGLADPDFGVRHDAIRQLGKSDAVPSGRLRQMLSSDQSHLRAAALLVLTRRRLVRTEDLRGLVQDSDPRVRAAVAKAMAVVPAPRSGDLPRLLKDADPAVVLRALESCAAKHHASTEALVRSLTTALHREGLTEDAANALKRLGTHAAAAIPDMLETFDDWTFDPGNPYVMRRGEAESLVEFGPPRVKDFDEVAKFLRVEDAAVSYAAARVLARGGHTIDNASVETIAAQLEQAANEWALRLRSQQNRWELSQARAAEACAIALWELCGDVERTVAVFEEVDPYLHLEGDTRPIVDESARSDDQNVALLVGLLRSRERSARLMALDTIQKQRLLLPKLKHALIDAVRDPDPVVRRQAGLLLTHLGPSHADDVMLIVIELSRQNEFSIGDFADAVRRLDQRRPGVLKVLRRGVMSKRTEDAVACGRALLALTDCQASDVGRLLQNAHLPAAIVLQVLARCDHSLPDSVVQPTREGLYLPDGETRIAAIRLAESLGPRGKLLSSKLTSMVTGRSPTNYLAIETHLAIGAALFRITGAPDEATHAMRRIVNPRHPENAMAIEMHVGMYMGEGMEVSFAKYNAVESVPIVLRLIDYDFPEMGLLQQVLLIDAERLLIEHETSRGNLYAEAITKLQTPEPNRRIAELRSSNHWLVRRIARRRLPDSPRPKRRTP